MQIRDLKNPWRDKLQTAMFRGCMFFVETGGRAGGRRVALHQYPKRNVPYAEDMGRTAVRFIINGYLIGPAYLDLRDNLITALEKDGPGMLRLPLPYRSSDVMVMVNSYSVTEARERGGFCTIEMDFIEYGDPAYRQTVSTPEAIDKAASGVENELIGPPTPELAKEAAAYIQNYVAADIIGAIPRLFA
jgi:prophage DNA circulation protein